MSTEEWERVLWKKQAFPDNHEPPSFLSSLKRNSNFNPYSYWQLSLSACAITQHLSAVFMFLVAFLNIHQFAWDPRVLVWISVIAFLLGYVIWEVLEYCSNVNRNERRENRAKTIKSSILVFLSLMSLSPVLRTLTAATSSDSIWALAVCLFILNVLLADYGPPRARYAPNGLTAVLSMNAAISASLVLASRLRNDTSVFALMLFSIQLFALFPILRARMMLMPASVRVLLTCALVTVSSYLGMSVSLYITTVHIAVTTIVTFGAPGVLFWAQKHKNEIKGPWDVAVPRVR